MNLNLNFMDKRLCRYLSGFTLVSFYAAVSLKTAFAATPTANLEDWRFYPEQSQLEFSLSAPSQPRYFYLSQPPRLVVDLPNTQLGYVPIQQTYSGSIQRIRVSQLNPSVTRIVMDLAPGSFLDPNQVQLQPVSWQNPTRWVLRSFTSGNNNSSQQGYFPPQPNNSLPNIYGAPPSPNQLGQNNLPPGIDNPPSQSDLPPNPQPGGYYSPLPSNAVSPPPTMYNNPGQEAPFVSVPPLNSNYPSQGQGSILPPATFGNQLGTPNIQVPTIPNNLTNPNSRVIEFGQPLP